MKLSIITETKNGRSPVTLKLKIINKGNRKTNPIKKFRRLAKIDDMGINSRGDALCFNTEELIMNEFVASVKAFIEKNQGIIPASTKRV